MPIAPDEKLHLPSLTIENFRGIGSLTIANLGRVTLLGGKNSVGKTTVLDAVRLYAARARAHSLSDVLLNRDETVNTTDDDGQDTVAPDWETLFFRRGGLEEPISIGPIDEARLLQIRVVPLSDEALGVLAPFQSEIFSGEGMLGLEIKFQDSHHTIPTQFLQQVETRRLRFRSPRIRRLIDGSELPDEVLCNSLGPDVPGNDAIDQYWDEVALTPHEERAVEALNLVTPATVERVASVGTETRSRLRSRRRILVKVKGLDSPVPLRSLGDGAVRSFSVALALAGSSNGFLLIDEIENGIHYSIQDSFWKMVLRTAQRNNVQVLATTHSLDCAYAFGQAASELEDVEGLYYRIQKNEERIRAVPYPESELVIAAEHGIEVR